MSTQTELNQIELSPFKDSAAYPCIVGGASAVQNYFHLGNAWPENSFCNSFQSLQSFFLVFLLLWNLFESGQREFLTRITNQISVFIYTANQINLISELIETYDSSYLCIFFFCNLHVHDYSKLFVKYGRIWEVKSHFSSYSWKLFFKLYVEIQKITW